MNRAQQILLRQLCCGFLEQYHVTGEMIYTIPQEVADEIKAYGLCEIVHIELGYNNDDFMHKRMSMKLGVGFSQLFFSKMVCDNSELIDHELKRDAYLSNLKANKRGVNVERDFLHIDYDDTKMILEITTFYKYKKK